MNLILLQGGLGNQMFEYALYKTYKLEGIDAKLDKTSYENIAENWKDGNVSFHNGYELDRIFNIDQNYATQTEIAGYIDSTNFFFRVLRKLGLVKWKNIFDKYIDTDTYFHKEILTMKNVKLSGYWCHYKYSEKHFDEIKKDFTFKLPLGKENENILNDIQNTNSVSLHVRHGDYQSLTNIYNIIGLDYYNKAMEVIAGKIENPVYYVFSDDIDWCKQNIKATNIVYVDTNHGMDSYKDMQLMSMCKHNIIANSTFSIMSALLNDNKDKTVISPKNYYSDKSFCMDGYPESWILLD